MMNLVALARMAAEDCCVVAVDRGGRDEMRGCGKNERLLKRGQFFARITMGLSEGGRAIDLLPSLLERVSP